MAPGQLSRQNYHRRWRLVTEKKLACWWPRERYVAVKNVIKVLP